ncbi:GNAT family N-acetyltransferase [Nostoc sp.]|uniref:GNAT family N-acetyltransferase n=1 Tax=Nostoc sp. TaxID=1180 RepID=UPI003FA5CFFD
MRSSFSFPSGYIIRYARNFADRWESYLLFVLQRPLELLSYNRLRVIKLVSITIFIAVLSAWLLSTNAWFIGVVLLSGILSYAVSSVVVWFLIFILDPIQILQSSSDKTLILALCQGKIIGAVLIDSGGTSSFLLRLYIVSSHRCRGIGSSLVRHLLLRTTTPVYVLALPGLQRFYGRLGFTEINPRNLPYGLQGYNMVFDPSRIPAPIDS